MAQTKEKFVTLYAPGGTEVEINETRAEVLKDRGYTAKPPRTPASTRRTKPGDNDQSAEVAELKAKLEQAEKERDEALSAATTPAAADKK